MAVVSTPLCETWKAWPGWGRDRQGAEKGAKRTQSVSRHNLLMADEGDEKGRGESQRTLCLELLLVANDRDF